MKIVFVIHGAYVPNHATRLHICACMTITSCAHGWSGPMFHMPTLLEPAPAPSEPSNRGILGESRS